MLILHAPPLQYDHKIPLSVKTHSIITSRLRELEDGTEPLDISRPSTVPASPLHLQQPPPAPMEIETTVDMATEPPPPLAELSPIFPATPKKPDTQSLEAKLRLESRIIELQGKNKSDARARRNLESTLTALEESQLQDQDTICSMQQRIHDLEESEKLYHERFAQLLTSPPLVQVRETKKLRKRLDWTMIHTSS